MRCTLGIDFGTLSARAIIVDTDNGYILGEFVSDYRNRVISKILPWGEKLPPGWALQNPSDYLAALEESVKGAIVCAGVSGNDIIGISLDFTCSTILPVNSDLVPICMLEGFQNNKHAYVKLWKHHAAQAQADRINRIGKQRGESFLERYCGYNSPEWAIPKILEVYEQAPEVSQRTSFYLEAGDWITSLLIGKPVHSSSFAAYKSMWDAYEGYPTDSFFEALSPGFSKEVLKHTALPVSKVGEKAGDLTAEYADILGLNEGIAVGVPAGDAFASVIGSCVLHPGEMSIVFGTSACDFLLADHVSPVQGIDTIIKDAIVPGLYAYEAGQSGSGDVLDWFVTNMVPGIYYDEAFQKETNIHQILTEKASRLKTGENGLVALEWINGNRSILKNVSLSGTFVGLNLNTRAEEMYRALLEADAFGQKIIIDTMKKADLPVNRIVLSGGIARKNLLFDQILADVLGCELFVSYNRQSSALGSAMYAYAAAGETVGGCDNIFFAAEKLKCPSGITIYPTEGDSIIYQDLFSYYCELHDYYGKKSNIMPELRRYSINSNMEN